VYVQQQSLRIESNNGKGRPANSYTWRIHYAMTVIAMIQQISLPVLGARNWGHSFSEMTGLNYIKSVYGIEKSPTLLNFLLVSYINK